MSSHGISDYFTYGDFIKLTLIKIKERRKKKKKTDERGEEEVKQTKIRKSTIHLKS